ncbi:MAG: hypothetical protein Q9163_006329, partial [Psora crenata]
DPLPAYVKPPLGTNNSRVSTPYHAQGGERTFFASPDLRRSSTNATVRGGHNVTGRYEKSPVHPKDEHIRATPAGVDNRNAHVNMAGASSPTATDTSSSEDDEDSDDLQTPPKGNTSPNVRRVRIPAGAGVRQKSGFSPHVNVEDAIDEAEAPHTFLNSGFRRRSGMDFPPREPNTDRSGLSMGHAMEHNASGSGPQSASAPAAPGTGEPFMQRHRSFDDNMYGSPSGSKSSDAPTNGRKAETPMYEKPGYNPFSSSSFSGPPLSEHQSNGSLVGSPHQRWSPASEQTPCWPYWAIPSSLPPIVENDCPKPLHTVLPIFANPNPSDCIQANNYFRSFRWAKGSDTGPSAATPPLRSQSSDTINMKFSPSDAPPKFGSDNSYFPPPSSNRPSKSTTFPVDTQSNQQASPTRQFPGNEPSIFSPDIPPPPKGPSKYSSGDWDKRFSAHTFEPPPSGSSSRTASRKRAGTPRTGSFNNLKRAGTAARATGFQPTVVDAGEETSVNSKAPTDNFNGSTTSSRASAGSDGSAMDIDSPPPPSIDSKSKENGDGVLPARAHPLPDNSPGPTFPPRADMPQQPGSDSLNMDLGGFNKVAPFASSNEGLDDIADLQTALPFESRASSNRPNFDSCTKRIEFPKVPKVPSPPSTVTKASWARYMDDMNAYMFKWNTFCAQMLLLFQNRQEEHREIGPSWIGQVGGDVDAYLKALDEDERARKYWEVANERHTECFRKLKKVREELLRRSQVAG